MVILRIEVMYFMKDKQKIKSKENLIKRSKAFFVGCFADPLGKKILQTGAIFLAIFLISLGYIEVANYLEGRYPTKTVAPKVEVEEVPSGQGPLVPLIEAEGEDQAKEEQAEVDQAKIEQAEVEEEFLPEYPTTQASVTKLAPPVKGQVDKKYGMLYSELFEDYRFHDGVDIKAEEGIVMAALEGVVVEVINDTLEGPMVVIEHQDGWKTYYGNLETVEVSPGQEIKKGDILGKLNKENRLHFSLYIEEQSVDPMKYLKL